MNRLDEAREAAAAEFKAEAARLGGMVVSDAPSVTAVWPEAAAQTTSLALSLAGERMTLTETAALRVPAEFPAELLERVASRTTAAGRLHAHLMMVLGVVGAPLLDPGLRFKAVAT